MLSELLFMCSFAGEATDCDSTCVTAGGGQDGAVNTDTVANEYL